MSSFLSVIAILVAAAVLYRIAVSLTLTEASRATEMHTVVTADGWHIKLYRYLPRSGGGEPVFLCHGVMENQFTFSSPPEHSLIDVLNEKGYDCWHIELRGNRSSRPAQGLNRSEGLFDDYLLQDIPAALAHIQRITGFPQVHWVGHSMGGMLLYTYELVHGREEIASATTLGSPAGFSRARLPRPRLLLSALKVFPDIFEFALRFLSPTFPLLRIHIPLAPINWRNMHPETGPSTFYNLAETPPYDVAEKLTRWGATNTWRVNRDQVNVIEGLKTLTVPLLVICGEADPFVSIDTATEFFDALPSDDKKMLVLSRENGHCEDYNHVDLVFGRNGRDEVYEPIAEWLAAHPIAVVEPAQSGTSV